MAISIDWGTRVISVPQSFLSFLGGTNYELDTNAFRLALRDLEDNEAGVVYPPTHNHNTETTLGGIQYARIIEIINGYTVTFEDVGSPYAVNLVGSNNNILDVTNLNNVAVRSNNSAGLMSMREIQFSTYTGSSGPGVWLDQANGRNSTLYPAGNNQYPCKTVSQARQIGLAYGLTTIYVVGDLILDTGDDVNNFRIVGENPLRTMITINPGADTLGVEIKEAAVTGTLDGTTILRSCYVFDLAYVSGFMHQCQLAGTITLGGVVPANMLSCFGASGETTIDMSGSGHALNISDWSGDVRIANKTGTDACQIHATAASVTLDATVTNGIGIHIDGTGDFINESAVTPEHIDILNSEQIWSYVNRTLTSGAGTDPWDDARALTVAKFLGLK